MTDFAGQTGKSGDNGNMSPRLNDLARLARIVADLRRRGTPVWGLVLVGVLLVGFLVARPALEQRFGISLPGPGPTASEPPTATPPPADGPPTLLREVRADVFESPAGLLYTPGSRQGHRTRHVLAHARDQPKRSGPHGVFDASEPDAVFALVDEAYRQAIAGQSTRVRREQQRMIYTVDLGRRIGYVGGEVGNQRGRPPASHLRLILEDQRVITAYPIRP